MTDVKKIKKNAGKFIKRETGSNKHEIGFSDVGQEILSALIKGLMNYSLLSGISSIRKIQKARRAKWFEKLATAQQTPR